MARRISVYWLPEGPLGAWGAGWLGHGVAGDEGPPPAVYGLPAPREEIVATPWKYGFHATLKPPFHFEAPAGEIQAETRAVAVRHRPFTLPRLRVQALGRFLALVPETASPAMNALAFDLVTGLDRFRLPPSEDELARRRRLGLSDRQEAMLAAHGYPFVGPEFRFHVTLTGPLGPHDLEATREALTDALAPLTAEPVPITEVALCGEGEDGAFRLIAPIPLGPR